jgi:hypothetical protein
VYRVGILRNRKVFKSHLSIIPYRFGKTPVGYEIIDSSDLEPLVDGEDYQADCVVSVKTRRINGKFAKTK